MLEQLESLHKKLLNTKTNDINMFEVLGIQNNEVVKVKGAGIPNISKPSLRGDIIVVIEIKTPTHISNEEKALYQKLYELGKNKTEATKFTISDENGTRHEIYVVDGKEKVWVVELKCAKSQKKEFDKTLTKVVDSLEFDQTVEKETTKEE